MVFKVTAVVLLAFTLELVPRFHWILALSFIMNSCWVFFGIANLLAPLTKSRKKWNRGKPQVRHSIDLEGFMAYC